MGVCRVAGIKQHKVKHEKNKAIDNNNNDIFHSLLLKSSFDINKDFK